MFLSVNEARRTRRHAVTLAEKQGRINRRKVKFSQRTVNEWNRLLADCVGVKIKSTYT